MAGALAFVVGVASLGVLVLTAVKRAETTAPPQTINDQLAGVSYVLPRGWTEGELAPVTGFTSAAVHDHLTTVMARPGAEVDPPALRSAVSDLTDLYARLLLQGNTTNVVDDRAITINGRPGHTLAVRAEYRNVVNEPAFLRVTVLTRPDGRSTVLLGMAHPDLPQSRAELDAVLQSAR